MQSVKMRRKVAASAAENGDSADKLDQLLLSAAVCNGEDLGPFIRKAFASGKPETLVHHLRHFTRSKESEIEDVCKAHYQDFIMAVDDLRSLLSDVDSLKSSLSNSNTQLQSVAGPLLTSLDSFVEARKKCLNITLSDLQALGFEDFLNLCSINGALLPSKYSYLAKQLLHDLKVSGIDRD